MLHFPPGKVKYTFLVVLLETAEIEIITEFILKSIEL